MYRIFLSVIFLIPINALAVESICPGGSSPRADITMCYDFESLGNCSTGREETCWSDNGIDNANRNNGQDFYITNGGAEVGTAAVGSGFIQGKGVYGNAGPGYTSFAIPNGGATAVNLRYYIKFTKGYLHYFADHGPGIAGLFGGCNRGGTLEQSAYNYYMYNTGTGCGAGSFDLYPNQSNLPNLKNNRWYLIEQQKIMDTSCSDTSSSTGCNGIARMWIDEQLVLEYTNVNWGGVHAGLKWTSIWGPRSYYHIRHPSWEPEVHFDNFAVSTNGTYIGPASSENSRGTADASSPYNSHQGIEPFLGRHPAQDCSTPSGYMKTNIGSKWRDGGTFDTSIKHGGFVDQCSNPPKADQSFKVSIAGSSGGGGVHWDRAINTNTSTIFPQQVIYGWIYLPSGNDYSETPALSGFRGYKCGSTCDESDWGRYLALTVNNNKWAIKQRFAPSNNTPQVVLTSNSTVQYDQWVEFELIVYSDQKVTLMINRQRLYDREDLPMDVPLMFSGGGGANSGTTVIGVIHFTGTGPFNVYYDDMAVGTVSFWSCDGWGASSCPFADADNTAPAAPTGLTVVQ